MSSPLRKFRAFSLRHHQEQSKDSGRPAAILEELVPAAQELEEMRNSYDSLLSAAASTTNSVYEFAESMEEMGTCLLEKAALTFGNDESGRALMMLGKSQFELQKFVDIYRTNIINTITNPSESLLKELQVVEEMKDQCDQKRAEYEAMLAVGKKKGQSKHSKTKSSFAAQLQASFLEYQEDVALFIFRLKSLKQGQFLSILTQAARHHAAQLNFFRRGLKHLEDLEPYIKAVAEKEHIDYYFGDLENDNDDAYCLYQDSHSDDSELSFDYEINGRNKDLPTPRISMDLDQARQASSQKPLMEYDQGNVERASRNLVVAPHLKPEIVTKSAPILSDNVLDSSMRFQKMRPSIIHELHILPKPADVKNSASSATSASPDLGQSEYKSRVAANVWQSSPLANGFKPSSMNNRPARMSLNTNQISAPLVYSHSTSESKMKTKAAFSAPVLSNEGLSKPYDHRTSMNSNPLEARPTKSGLLSSVAPKVIPKITSPSTTSPRIKDENLYDPREAQPNANVQEDDDEATARCQVYSYDVLEVATCHFSNNNKLGSGGFGTVYKGTLENGKEVAVKKLWDFKKSSQELEREVSIVAELRHNNVVRFLGYCFQDKGRLLVYEYLPNNSLDKFWKKGSSHRPKLEWTTWFSIIKGVACGLQFLHNKGILHRDLKPTNVLLDKDFNPKIADFDLVRVYDKDKTHESTEKVAGTLGYMAPECTRGQRFQLSIKSDVYSYGVLVLEIITGRKIHTFEGHNSESLVEYVWQHWTAKKVCDVVDSDLDVARYEKGQQQALRCVHIALLCVQSDRSKRPSMGEVIAMLSTEQNQMELQEPSLLGYLHPSSVAAAGGGGRSPWLLPCFQC